MLNLIPPTLRKVENIKAPPGAVVRAGIDIRCMIISVHSSRVIEG